MKIYHKLLAQHLGWTFKQHWKVQGKRVARDSGASAELLKHGTSVKNPNLGLQSQNYFKLHELTETEDKEMSIPSSFYLFRDKDVPLKGVEQAQALSNTIVQSTMPHEISSISHAMVSENHMEQICHNFGFTSHISNEKKKISIKPYEPDFNMSKNFKLSHKPVIRTLVKKLLHEMEKNTSLKICSHRKIVDDYVVKVCVQNKDSKVQFDLNFDLVILSTKPLEPVKHKIYGSIPDLNPMKCTISLPRTNNFFADTVLPRVNSSGGYYPNTLLTIVNDDVNNARSTVLTNSQLEGRTLLAAFAVASAQAKKLYGEEFKSMLPCPITVQCIQAYRNHFNFGVYQLNTMLLDCSDVHNYWFSNQRMDLTNS